MKLRNNISEQQFQQRFPLPFIVRALTPWEAARKRLDPGTQHWEFAADFVYVSDKFGAVTVPKGFVTDFASIPSAAKAVIDDDAPTILFASAPHDKLFAYPYSDSGRQLTLREVNALMAEAMYYCGSGALERLAVRTAVATGGALIWRRMRRQN